MSALSDIACLDLLVFLQCFERLLRWLNAGMLEALENSSEKSEEQRRLEDLEFERLSQTVNLFGFEDNGKEEASSADSYSVDVFQHAVQ